MKAFHLTKIENLYGDDGIISIGLVPKNGDRSKSINDMNEAIYFSSSYYTIRDWWLYLYPKLDPRDLCVLTFDIPDEYCIEKQKTEYYTSQAIPPEDISIVRFFNEIDDEEVLFTHLQKNSLDYGDWGSKPKLITYRLEETPITSLINDKEGHKKH